MDTFFQVGTLMPFLQGIYEGDYSLKQLAKEGNCGLGTFNGVDGELVALDGHFYQMDKTGNARIVAPETKTPFAVVSHFQPAPALVVHHVPNIANLNQLLDQHLLSKNIFYMIRIEAELDWIKLRSEACQSRPYRPLDECLPQTQHTFELHHSQGSLIASYCPEYSKMITIAGYHYHFIDKARKIGGHVFDFKIKSARIMINPLRQFKMALLNTTEFDELDIEVNDLQMALKKIE
jgi:acetolactate decarboxylase